MPVPICLRSLCSRGQPANAPCRCGRRNPASGPVALGPLSHWRCFLLGVRARARWGPSLARVGPTMGRSRPRLGDFDPFFPMSNQTWAEFCRRQDSATLGQMWTKFGPTRTEVCQIRPTLARLGLNMVNLWPNLVDLSRRRLDICSKKSPTIICPAFFHYLPNFPARGPSGGESSGKHFSRLLFETPTERHRSIFSASSVLMPHKCVKTFE